MTRSTPVASRALGILSGARSVADGAAIPLGCFGQCNPKALGLPIAAWLRIRPVPGQLQKVAEILQGLPEIVECDRITGEDCFIARAQIQSVEELEKLIDQVIPYAMTNT